MLGSATANLPIDVVAHGVLTRTVRDTANFLAGMEQYYRPKNLPEIGNVRGPSDKRLKIALFTQSPVGIEAHQDVVNAVVNAGKKCEALGHRVEHIPNPYQDSLLFDFLVYYSLLAWLSTTFGRFAVSWKFDVRKAEPFTRELGRCFYGFLLMAPGAIRRLRNDVVARYRSLLGKYDVLLTPTLANPTPKLKFFSPELGLISLVSRLNNHVGFTTMHNATGAPAISLPMGVCSNGLPVGVQFAAGPGEERKVLELAFELEGAGALGRAKAG